MTHSAHRKKVKIERFTMDEMFHILQSQEAITVQLRDGRKVSLRVKGVTHAGRHLQWQFTGHIMIPTVPGSIPFHGEMEGIKHDAEISYDEPA